MGIISTIFKKEIRVTFTSKSSIFGLLLPMGIFLLVFIPLLGEMTPETPIEEIVATLSLFTIISITIVLLVGQTAFPMEFQYRTIKLLLVSPVSEKEIFLGKSLPCLTMGIAINTALSIFLMLFINARSIPIDPSIPLALLGLGSIEIILTSFVLIAVTIYLSGEMARFLPALVPVGIILSVFLIISFVPGSILFKISVATVIMAFLSLVTFRISIAGFKRERLILKGGT